MCYRRPAADTSKGSYLHVPPLERSSMPALQPAGSPPMGAGLTLKLITHVLPILPEQQLSAQQVRGLDGLPQPHLC